MIKNYFTFKGRLNRKPYWIMSLILTAIMIAAILAIFAGIGSMTSTLSIEPNSLGVAVIVGAVLFIPFLISGFSVMVRRLHDRNKSAWWIVIFYFGPSLLMEIGTSLGAVNSALFIILYGAGLALIIWALIELGFLKGTDGPNQFGPDPLNGANVDPDVFS